MKRHSGDRHSSPWCIQISLWIGAIVTFFVSPPSLISAKAGRGDDHLAGALSPECGCGMLWRGWGNRVARGESRGFLGEGRSAAFIDEKNAEFEMMESTGNFVSTTFPTMSHALAHVARITGETWTAEARAWTR